MQHFLVIYWGFWSLLTVSINFFRKKNEKKVHVYSITKWYMCIVCVIMYVLGFPFNCGIAHAETFLSNKKKTHTHIIGTHHYINQLVSSG